MTTQPRLSTRLERARDILREGVIDGVFSHVAFGLKYADEPAIIEHFGKSSNDIYYDLASLTKPLCTATLILQLVECGRLHLLETISSIFGSIIEPSSELASVTIKQLLTHTSGLPPAPMENSDAHDSEAHDVVLRCLQSPLVSQPGTAYSYSDTGYILLGKIAELVCATRLDALFTQHISGAIDRNDIGFLTTLDVQITTAPTGCKDGLVHDPRARAMGGVAGHAGLFGTVDSVLEAAYALTATNKLVSTAGCRRLLQSQIDPSIGAQSFGLFCSPNPLLPAGDLFSERTVGHSGFTGTLFLTDPETNITIVLLSNRVAFNNGDSGAFLKLRRYWLNTVAAAANRTS